MTEASGYAFRDPRPLGGAVVVWQYLYLVATIANLAMVGLEFQSLSGGDLDTSFNRAINPEILLLLSTATRLASVCLYVVAGILFLKWTYRIVANARTLRSGMRAKPGWAIGWYFVPIAFLWKPFEYFKEAWEVSHNPSSPAQVNTPGILRWWWGLWLLSIIASNISGRLAYSSNGDRGMDMASDVFEMVSDGLTVPLILIVVRMIKTLSDTQFRTQSAGAAAVFS